MKEDLSVIELEVSVIKKKKTFILLHTESSRRIVSLSSH